MRYEKTGIRPHHRICRINRRDDLIYSKSKTRFCCLYVDTIDYYRDKLNTMILELDAARNIGCPDTNVGFVTFTTKEAANSVILNENVRLKMGVLVDSLNVKDCLRISPDPNDIIWENLINTSNLWRLSEILFFSILMIFYTIPIAFVSGLADVHIISKLNVTFHAIVANATVQSVVENFLATFVFFLFTLVLPTLLRYLIYIGKPTTHSSEDRRMTNRYFIALVIIVFLKIGYTHFFEFLFSKISMEITFHKWTNGFISNSTFFVSYLALSALLLAPLELYRFPGIFYLLCCSRSTAISYLKQIDYGIYYPVHLLIFTIALVYSVYTPLVLPFAPIYFGITYSVFRYQMVYVYVPKYEASGKM